MKGTGMVMIKTLIAVWSLLGGSLSLLLDGYATDVPIAKYLFTILESLDGRGVEVLFAVFGIGTIMYLVRHRQKNPAVSALSLVFAVCTVFGISYAKCASWDGIFLFGTQFLFAVLVTAGYYLLYKNGILFIGFVLDNKKELWHIGRESRIGRILFEKHPFWGPFIFIVVFSLPWLVAFCPGTLQWDAHGQLWMAMGAVEQTGYHPVFISNYMWGCVKLGRMLFGSDSVGLFLYTFPQFIVQCLVFAYAMNVMRRMKTPELIRWSALFLWAVFPYFQIWGFTMVKDTPYYIGFVLWLVVVADMISSCAAKKQHYVLMAVATAFMALSRNDGRYVLVVSLVAFVVAYRKYWKVFVLGVITCIVLLVVQEGIYMPAVGIAKGPAGEMLSVPLQQTARYLRDHWEEVTPEEAAVLQDGFEIELDTVGDKYNPVISDPVKSNFIARPDDAYMKEYFKVWFAQFTKHPDTYVQAFLNQIYGYFYPNYPNYGDYLTVTYMGNAERLQDEHLDLQFAMNQNQFRELMRHLIYTVEQIPGFSLLYGCGIYTYMLIGMTVFLWVKKKWREVIFMLPAFCVLLICLVSPVNGYLRYLMPVMAGMPVLWAWSLGAVTGQVGKVETNEG